MNQDLLKKYCHAIKSFEERIKVNTNPNLKKKGNLIKYSDYEDLKKKVGYKNDKIKGIHYNINDKEKIMKLKDLEINSLSYLNNLILNDNIYILIDNTFWKIVNEKEKDPGTVFEYKIESNFLKFIFGNDKELKFTMDKNKNNIIKKDFLQTKKDTGFNYIIKIYNSIQKYYNFEKELSTLEKSEKEEKGYLVDLEWVDSWKKDVNYELIKKEFILKGLEEKEIKNKLIYLYEKNKVKLFDLDGVKKIDVNTKEKLENYLKNNSLVLLDENFVSVFGKKQNLCEIKYKLLKTGIEIIFDSSDNIICGLKGNIITSDLSSSEENQEDQIKHEVIKENSSNTNDTNNNKNNKFESDIISFLLILFLEEKDFLQKVEESKINFNNSIKDYSLVNSDVFDEFKKCFSYDDEVKKIIEKFKIKSIPDINQALLDKIIKEQKILSQSNKEDFSKKFTFNNFFDIKSNTLKDFSFNKFFIYPEKVQFLEKDLANKLKNILGKSDNDNIEEISLSFNLGNIIFKPTKGKFFDENKNYAYIYSLSKEEKGIIKFFPEVLISFNTKDSLNNHFQKLIKDETLIDSCIKNISHINATLRYKAMLINKTNYKLFTKSKDNSIQVNTLINPNKEEENIDKCISVSINLNEEYLKLKKSIDEQNYNSETECYLISKNFMKAIEDIFAFEEINEIINKNRQILTKCKNEKEKLEIIKKDIKNNTKNELKGLDEKSMEYKIKNKDILNFDLSKSFIDDKDKRDFYFGECKLISKDIFGIIKERIKLYIGKIKSVKCIFDKGEIIILIKDGNDESINIGNLETENSLKIKYIIKKENTTPKLSDIFSEFKKSGYNYIKKYITSSDIRQQNKEPKIISLSRQNMDKNKVEEKKNASKNNHGVSQKQGSSGSNHRNKPEKKDGNTSNISKSFYF